MRRTHSVVTPGNHDGVHLGHRALIDAAKRTADARGWQTLAMCFEPHPTAVLAPQRAPVLLTDMRRRVEILRGAGCDDVVVLPFDSEFSKMTPDQFVERVLLDTCRAKGVVVGPDFHFGHKRSGNIGTLRDWGNREGFTVQLVQPVMFEGQAVSSTRIRRVLAEDGNVGDAARMMTRVHETTGLVTRGDQRGRQLGFPTANLAVEPLQLPKDGVYAVVARVLDEPGAALQHGVANLGYRPTFEAGHSIEVHLLGFEGDLYGRRMRVGFVARIRGETKFDGLDALRRQIDRDCDEAENALQQMDSELVRWI
ncbi:MAG: bifunctional riboflavin kinase/FAD synthetase [Deltaproteobacteria bacterium]|nr:bifunctional riboflavin kinase/FAD synthetase [Deltaproteobacteria bacterium]NND29250.1 bifunctional riboflavin kinase/FAD synthetase [Myxococcales bacterium]MBT8463721.1 bifunctional riboflavin kinase/FAD synthetase [Deltaproteobacteria bacterium]MBT8483380.1 bifunctional riboflavin kinase/FAD synthetase [Deltaproteobacteria bacterium]NNK05887.1 bifunctional riboflavin kinase/FAD synthetase [Myxococcales bacterium]